MGVGMHVDTVKGLSPSTEVYQSTITLRPLCVSQRNESVCQLHSEHGCVFSHSHSLLGRGGVGACTHTHPCHRVSEL